MFFNKKYTIASKEVDKFTKSVHLTLLDEEGKLVDVDNMSIEDALDLHFLDRVTLSITDNFLDKAEDDEIFTLTAASALCKKDTIRLCFENLLTEQDEDEEDDEEDCDDSYDDSIFVDMEIGYEIYGKDTELQALTVGEDCLITIKKD